MIQSKGSAVSQRDEREMSTLSSILDNLADGRLAEVGDVAMQRCKAVELASSEKSWDVAQRLEIVPSMKPSALSTAERHAAANHQYQELKLQEMMKKADGGKTRR